MKILNNIQDTVGKTVIRTQSFDDETSLAIFFHDETCLILEVSKDFDGFTSIDVITEISDSYKHLLGIMSDETYDQIQVHKAQVKQNLVEEHERLQLAMLKKKYEE